MLRLTQGAFKLCGSCQSIYAALWCMLDRPQRTSPCLPALQQMSLNLTGHWPLA